MALVGVTGAAGFIGGLLVPRLAQAGHRLVLVDDLSAPQRVLRPEWPVRRADFAAPESLRRLGECDVLLHLGAVSGVMACANDPVGSALVNVEGTQRLLTAAEERGVAVAFASSFATVGVPDRLPITEATPAKPTHEYARQKAEGERRVHATSRVPTAVLRMSNVYGTYRVGERVVAKGNVLNLFAGQAQEGFLRVNAPGTQRRDFVHVEDVVAHWEAAARYLAERRGRPGSWTFNVASGTSLSILELAERVRGRWSRLHPERPPLSVNLVDNPRGSIELLQPEFAIDRSWTERELRVRCEFDLDRAIDLLLQSPPTLPPATGAATARPSPGTGS